MANNDINYEKLIGAYIEGKSLDVIKNEFGFSSIIKTKDAIHMYIKDNNLKNIKRDRIRNIKSLELIELRNKGMKNTDISMLYDISAGLASEMINKYYFNNNINNNYKKEKISLDIESVINDLKNGFNLGQLQEKYKVSTTAIKKRLLLYMSEEEIQRYLHSEKEKIMNNAQEYITLFESGVLLNDILQYTDITSEYLKKILKKEYGTRPLVVTKKNLYNICHSNSFKSIEEMQEESKKGNKIIPRYIINEYKGKKLDINKIKEYLKDLIAKNKDDAEFKELMKNNKALYDKLSQNASSEKTLITALLNGLPQSKYSSFKEISEIINSDLDITNALLYLGKDEELEFSRSPIAYFIREAINENKHLTQTDKALNTNNLEGNEEVR